MRDLHANAEAIYQDGLAKAAEYRRTHPQGSGTSSKIDHQGVLIWDLYYPNWNCLLGKERVGKLGAALYFGSFMAWMAPSSCVTYQACTVLEELMQIGCNLSSIDCPLTVLAEHARSHT